MEQKQPRKEYVVEAVTEFSSRIAMYQNKFSAMETKIAEYLMQNEDRFRESTIYDLAEEIGTSPATLIRFSKKIGYQGFADLKFHVLQGALSLAGEDIGICAGDSINTLKQKAMQYTTNALQQCILNSDNEEIKRAIKLISSCSRLLIVGSGSASGIAQAGVGLFLSIGVCAFHLEDSLLLNRSAAYLDQKDVLLSVSYNGCSRVGVDAMMIAKDVGASTILITSCHDSLMGAYADTTLYTPARRSSNALNVSTTGICQLSVLQTLQIGVWMENQERCAEKSAEILRYTRLSNYDKTEASHLHLE